MKTYLNIKYNFKISSCVTAICYGEGQKDGVFPTDVCERMTQTCYNWVTKDPNNPDYPNIRVLVNNKRTPENGEEIENHLGNSTFDLERRMMATSTKESGCEYSLFKLNFPNVNSNESIIFQDFVN